MAKQKSQRTPDREVNGLYVRHGKRGNTYNYARVKSGKMVRAALGSTALHTLDAARRWATNLNLDAAGLPRDYTLREVVAAAVAKATKKGNRQPSYLRIETQKFCPDWLDRPLSSITKGQINERHNSIAGPTAGARFVCSLRTLYKFAENNLGYEGRNPAMGIEVQHPRPRHVVWQADELERFLAAAAAEHEFWHSFFTVAAFTGMRRNNVCQMEWAEVDMAAATWTIPASKFKNKTQHTVHLLPDVIEALATRRAAAGGRWVFPSITDPRRPLVNPRVAFHRICKAAGVTGRTIHDLRRTLGSRLASKVPLPVVAKVLGHRTLNTTLRSYAVISDATAKDAMVALLG